MNSCDTDLKNTKANMADVIKNLDCKYPHQVKYRLRLESNSTMSIATPSKKSLDSTKFDSVRSKSTMRIFCVTFKRALKR